MADSQRILWTAVPNGVVKDGAGDVTHLEVVAVVNPRLITTTASHDELSFFPDWVDWPATVNDPNFSLHVILGSNPAVEVELNKGLLRSDLWTALFTNTTFVRPYDFSDMFQNFANRPIVSYPMKWINDFLREHYVNAITNAQDELPLADDLMENLGEIGFPASRFRESDLRDELLADLDVRKAFPKPPTQLSTNPLTRGEQIRKEFLKARIFFEVLTTPPPDAPAPRAHQEQPDFHDALAFLNSFPALQRLLGLVFDLRVPVGRTGIPTNSIVRLLPRFAPQMAATDHTRPFTNYSGGGSQPFSVFMPRPKSGGPIEDGFLSLEESEFGLVQMDTDGAALSARMFGDNLRRSHLQHPSVLTPEREALPALRSGGFAVVREDRAFELHLKFVDIQAKNTSIESSGTPTLFADDLLHGVRWDVFDQAASQWYSLMRRNGDFDFTRPATPIHLDIDDEEGELTTGVVQSADGTSDRLVTPETVGRWDGWSLVAPRPGKSVPADPAGPPEGHPSVEHPDFKLKTSFDVHPGSLPAMRFGREYRMRARVTYLGGAGIPFSPGGAFGHATDLEHYGRFEPIQAPGLLMTAPRTEGESVEHMVIRSNFNTAPAATLKSFRHVVPPHGSYILAEQHEMFDVPTGVDEAQATYDLIAQRENLNFHFPTAPGYHEDPFAQGLPYYDVPVLEFPFPDTPPAEVPYLPDPMSRGATFRGLPAQVVAAERMDFYPPSVGNDWPYPRAFRIQLQEGANGYTKANRRLVVNLGKAEVRTVLLSSYPVPGSLDSFGLWHWIQQDAPGSVPAIEPKALAGRFWPITPFRVMKMVHAVRQPLVLAVFSNPGVDRGIGDTFAEIRDTITFSRKSTGTIDIHASWSDPVDDLSKPAPEVLDRTDRPAHIRVPREGPDGTMLLVFTHEFKNTQYHKVKYRMNAKTAFAEYFAVNSEFDFPPSNEVVLDPAGLVPDSVRVRTPDEGTRFREGPDYTINENTGVLTRVPSGDIGPNEVVRVRYIAQPVDRLGPIKEVRVRNSKRPAAPKVLYILPAWAWDETRTPSKLTSKRQGNYLRVYLERPWWDSGYEETLGVVFKPQANPSARLDPYVTKYGFDPIYLSAATKPFPVVGDFPLRTVAGTSLSLAELKASESDATLRVNVAGHEVHFDPARKLWYCDVRILGGLTSYMPFVRLGLARYQPNSITNAHLSRIVRAQFAQLTPDRTATVVFEDNDRIRISVIGLSYKMTDLKQGPATVTAKLQRYDSVLGRDPDPTQGDELGWADVQGPALTLTSQTVRGGFTLWKGTMIVPARGTYRLLIREFEVFANFSSRMVYADTILL